MILPPAALATLNGLARIPNAAAAIAPCLLPPVRTMLRDALIRDTLARHYGHMAKTPAAYALAADMRAEQFDGTPKAEALAAILALSEHGPIKARQIVNVADGK